MFVLPSFTLGDILTFLKAVKIKTANGAILPFICISNSESRSWKTPEHPTDSNIVISDTIYSEPITISLQGHIPMKSWERFKQLISGNEEKKANFVEETINNIIGRGGTALSDKYSLNLYEVKILGGIYKDMALIGITRNETPEENSGYSVTLDFKQVVKVQAKSSDLSADKVGQVGDGNPLDNSKVQPKEPPRNSMAYDLLNSSGFSPF